MVLTLDSVNKILEYDHANGATERYSPVVLFIMQYKVVLTLNTVNEILECPSK